MKLKPLPHRSESSRRTHISKNRVTHIVEDGRYEHPLTESTHPKSALDFIQKLIAWYESDVDHRDELPLFVDVADDGCIYVKDAQGGEWVMWSVDEWTTITTTDLSDPDARINPGVARTVFNAVVQTYEHPEKLKQQQNRIQIESC